MKKILLLATICLLLLFGGCAKRIVDTTVTIYGMVLDADTQMPIDGVLLSISPNVTGSKTTGPDGYYEFVDIEQGRYTIWASKGGYKPDHKSANANHPGEEIEMTFVLHKE